LSAATVSGALGSSAAGASTSGRTILAGSAAPAQARQHPVGSVSKSSRVYFDLVLKLRDQAGAEALLRAVSTPGSASYRHYLTPARWESRFSPSAKTVGTARAWLRGQGFTVSGVSKDRMTISASGTAAQVEKAFGTGLGYFRVAGHTVRLATKEMSMPTSLAGSVIGTMGVNQSIARPAVATTAASSAVRQAKGKIKFPPPPPAFLPSPPCGSFYNQKIATVKPAFGHGYPDKVPYTVCGYKPGQFRSAYNVGSATGKGATVAIVDAYGSATIASDSTRYFRMNDPGNPFANAHLTQLLATPFNLSASAQAACDPASWLVEQAIDVQSVHSVARNAHIVYVGAKSCFNNDLFAADQKVVDNRLADALTNSFGTPSGDVLLSPAERAANDNLFLMAGSIGMTVSFSTGDDGDNFDLTGISAPSYPASSPFVTAVGGTSLQIGRSGKVIGQVGWSTGRSFKCTANAVGALPGCTKSTLNTWLPVTYDGGSGGYTSYNYLQPWYQKPVVPAPLALRNAPIFGPTPLRVIPDISLDADPSTGFLIGLHQTLPNGTARYTQTRFGGTSLASPLLAGVIAVVDGLQTASGGSSVGFINPTIYRLVRSPGGISDVLPGGKQAQLRVDHAIFVTGGKGSITSFRQLTYEGPITYCDGAGNCATRDNTLSTAKGYDSMTGLGAPGSHFITDLAKS
jgi:subtilase family serine protease